MARLASILAARLHNQWLARPAAASPAAVVERLCAVQAQDFIGAKWAVGVRAELLDDAAVASAFDRGEILRTHVMRPTWHFVTPADIRWMLTLTAPRVHQTTASYYRQLGLDPKTLSRAHRVLASELEGGRFRTRGELAAALAKRGVEARGPRLGVLTIHAELEQVLCSGPTRGRELTYALFDERASRSKARTPRDPGAELAARYFASHGPATIRDFVWWSGLTVAQATRGIEQASPALVPRPIDGVTYWASNWEPPARVPRSTFLLPNYDEYVIAYKDRDLMLPACAKATARQAGDTPVGGIAGLNAYAHPLVVDGVLAGYWTRRHAKGTTSIEVKPWEPLAGAAARAVNRAAERLGEFSGYVRA